MERRPEGILQSALSAADVRQNPPAIVILDPGTPFIIHVPRMEWLGHEGLYAEISVPGVAGRFRVRYHLLGRAAATPNEPGSTIPAACAYVVLETAVSWDGRTAGPRQIARFATRKQADAHVRALDSRPGREGWYYTYEVKAEAVRRISVRSQSA